MQRVAKFALIALGLILLGGVMWGGVMVAGGWFFRGELPPGTWWQWLLAIPLIGAAALFFEGIGEVIGRAFGIGQRGTPKWKEALGILASIAVVAAILIVYNWLR